VTHEPQCARIFSNWNRGCLGFLCLCLLTAYVHSQTPDVGADKNPAATAEEQAPTGNSSANNPPARAGRISFLKGKVSFLRAGLDQWSEAALNFTVTTGDRMYTDRNSWAELQTGPYTVRISNNTDLKVTNLNDQIMQLGLEQGVLRLSIYQLPSGNTVEVDTPNGALTVQKPGDYRVDVDRNGSYTFVTVNSGGIEVTGGGVTAGIESGQAVKLTGHDTINVESMPIPPPDDFDRWSEGRDRRRESAKSGQYVSPALPGYDDLDEYGHWDNVADYGPVWYPTVAVGWMPYRFGHWAWIGPWGWTWVEDEPWGFCPFHYGRWVHIGVAWGWLPGPIVPLPVFAPGLVAFLGGAGFSIGVNVNLVGWFPLGPGEPFFPWYHYGGDYLRVVNITNIRNVTNITNITNINNVHYAYRTIATTAVPRNVFSNGESVARQVVRIPPDQLAKAQVVPHPSVNPTARAAAPGRPVTAPPVQSRPLAAAARPAATERSTAAYARPTSAAARSAPAEATRAENTETARQSSSRLITRSTPPPSAVPFSEERAAMAEHPGRALEPAQIANLRAGRPAGPMVDREFPAHFGPVIHERIGPHTRMR
jgi:hypothetical protein